MGLAHADLQQLPPPPPAPSILAPSPTSKGKPGDGFFPSPGYGVPAGWRDGDRSYNSQLSPKGRSGCWAGRGFPPPGERAWGCCAAPEAETMTLKTPPPQKKRLIPCGGYLLKRCSLGAPWFKLEDRLVGHLDGRAVLPSPPRRGAGQTLKSPRRPPSLHTLAPQ